MFLITINVSLASFQLPNITLLYLDPYNNTFGEEDWFVVFCTAMLSIISIFLTFLMLGIVMFVKYGIEDTENRKLLDELISFAMITSIFMLLPASILMLYRNVFGPLPSILVTKILLNVQIVCPEQFKQLANIQTIHYHGQKGTIILSQVGADRCNKLYFLKFYFCPPPLNHCALFANSAIRVSRISNNVDFESLGLVVFGLVFKLLSNLPMAILHFKVRSHIYLYGYV